MVTLNQDFLDDLQQLLDEEKKSESLKKLEAALKGLTLEQRQSIEGLADLEAAITDYRSISRKGMTPEEYLEEKETAWEEIASALDNLSVEEEEEEKPPPEAVRAPKVPTPKLRPTRGPPPEEFRPTRGGFLRAFGCAQFIVSFLKGEGPEGSGRIDPVRGTWQQDIFFEYKQALRRDRAEDMVAREKEGRVKKGLPGYTSDEEAERLAYWMGRISAKFTWARYHSFLIYFGMLKRLGWVEPTGETKTSDVQEPKLGVVNPAGQPRVFYRITDVGMSASESAIMNPLRALYPEFGPDYFRGKRAERAAKH